GYHDAHLRHLGRRRAGRHAPADAAPVRPARARHAEPGARARPAVLPERRQHPPRDPAAVPGRGFPRRDPPHPPAREPGVGAAAAGPGTELRTGAAPRPARSQPGVRRRAGRRRRHPGPGPAPAGPQPGRHGLAPGHRRQL
ncbi:MAG: HspR, transcriptional repressor of DnaK operon, partial [uncultured Arthrobacter sp.]